MTDADERDEPLGPGSEARALVATAEDDRAVAVDLLQRRAVARQRAQLGVDAIIEEAVREQLAAISVESLRGVADGLRLGALDEAGYGSVASVLAVDQADLEAVHGVGAQTAIRVVGAARTLEQAVRQAAQPRFDVVATPPLHTDTLRAVRQVELTDRALASLEPQLRGFVSAVDRLLPGARRAASRLRSLFTFGSKRERDASALQQLDGVVESSRSLLANAAEGLTALDRELTDAELWSDYQRRAAAYNGVVIDIGGLELDREAAQGFLPEDVAARVSEHPLDTSLLDVSLRGYQAFGARFALAQRHVMVGDEMGLGKTVEALAAIAHLAARGRHHALVVCPASVLINWTLEVARHTRLEAFRVHGDDRAEALDAWISRGGVAVTTFDSLRSLGPPPAVELAMLVVDEAHYVKNPEAQRTQAVLAWRQRAERTLFLSGTPMENRVEEFRALVGHLRPDVADQVEAVDGLAGAAAFRAAVAPVYLRRNQVDVLAELPPRVETAEWLDFVGDDLAAYRQAVVERQFMAMRRAAFVPATTKGSAKLDRLVEIVDEALENGRKVVVFSYFLDVLDIVCDVLGEVVVGPLHGGVPAPERQALVDELTAREEPCVLVSQIESGGTGLNIQAASVVVLCEPQWKPSTEEQAIARCHRMGQVRPVDVHRLLVEDSVDERMVEVLAAKARLVDEYVEKSDLKDAAAQATDQSPLANAERVASEAQEERRIIHDEQRRLGLEDRSGADEGEPVRPERWAPADDDLGDGDRPTPGDGG